MLNEIKKFIDSIKPAGIVRRLESNIEYWNEIINYNKDNICVNKSEMVYLYINQISQPSCKCGKTVTFVSYVKGYREFCKSSCTHAKEAATERRIKKANENGGMGLSNPKTYEKYLKTLNENHQTTNPSKLKSHKKMMRQHNPMFDEDVKHKHINNFVNAHNRINPAQLVLNDYAYKILNDEKMLNGMYKENGNSIIDILDIDLTTLYRYLKKYNIRDSYQNAIEYEIGEFLNGLGVKYIQNSKSIIPPLQLDFYLPELNIAIEYCGLYWHSDAMEHIDKNYHYEKMERCKNKNIQLITIFEDEWLGKKEVCKSALLSKFGLITERYYARKMQVKEISNNETKAFLNSNHLQGYGSPSSICLGLYDGNNLNAVMVFKKKRTDIWELVRFCTGNYNIVGAAGKLFKYFTRNYNPESIISFSDNRWSDGNLYNVLGFEIEYEIRPDYWYCKNQKRYHKFNFRKKKLIKYGYDDKWTEKHAMQDMKYNRIWDCGKIKWIYHAKECR